MDEREKQPASHLFRLVSIRFSRMVFTTLIETETSALMRRRVCLIDVPPNMSKYRDTPLIGCHKLEIGAATGRCYQSQSLQRGFFKHV